MSSCQHPSLVITENINARPRGLPLHTLSVPCEIEGRLRRVRTRLALAMLFAHQLMGSPGSHTHTLCEAKAVPWVSTSRLWHQNGLFLPDSLLLVGWCLFPFFNFFFLLLLQCLVTFHTIDHLVPCNSLLLALGLYSVPFLLGGWRIHPRICSWTYSLHSNHCFHDPFLVAVSCIPRLNSWLQQSVDHLFLKCRCLKPVTFTPGLSLIPHASPVQHHGPAAIEDLSLWLKKAVNSLNLAECIAEGGFLFKARSS